MNKTSILIQKINKNTNKKEWALVSLSDKSKILKWFGVQKPSEEKVKKEEQRVQFFKNIDKKKIISKVIKKLTKIF